VNDREFDTRIVRRTSITKTGRLIFKLRNHPKLRRAYVDPLIIAGLVMLLHLLQFLHVLEYFTGKH
jgi:hypothetical protein